MSDEAFGERPLGAVPQNWRPGLELAARWPRSVYGRHPWMAQAVTSFARPTATPHAMRYTEWALRALAGTGLPPRTKLHIHLTLHAHVQGLAMAGEPESQTRQDTGLSAEEWMVRNEPHFNAISASGEYPFLSALFEHKEFELGLGILFEFGLRRTLDGIAMMFRETSA
ncbi:TetR/AcrR family transcriptional regulator C-terminal domain-containing protein [Streptomyces sp. NPDC006510]|uniref:TetR/AcrR family transcriptional regulator C-terminal domain-containing protein n=1 Tax=Streptomyces sp. NPDC006510 TaxID=3155600 RepID=UPI0033B47E9F